MTKRLRGWVPCDVHNGAGNCTKIVVRGHHCHVWRAALGARDDLPEWAATVDGKEVARCAGSRAEARENVAKRLEAMEADDENQR